MGRTREKSNQKEGEKMKCKKCKEELVCIVHEKIFACLNCGNKPTTLFSSKH
jgi:ribosomal protein L37AE/L43A